MPSFLYVFFLIYFLMWTIFKVFIKFVTVLLLFYILAFGQEVCGALAPPNQEQTHPLH